MSKIIFKINGKQHEVDGRFGPDVSLNEYIRTVADLRGTKVMCQEGGCGACVVAVRAAMPPTNEVKIFSVNSCLVSVLSCHEWEVITVEGIGNRTIGYHEIQSRLAAFNGTQCGYCTPGWIMNMYSVYESKNKKLTMSDVENSFASNICRCTGYRPIADAFKSFATDMDDVLKAKLVDLEDLAIMKPCGVKCKDQCPHEKNKKCKDSSPGRSDSKQEEEGWCVIGKANNKMIVIDCGTHKWFKVYTLEDTFNAIAQSNNDYKVIAGNTGQGVYHVTDYPRNVIDIFNVAEIKGYMIDVNLIIGAGMPLSDMMELFLTLSTENKDFAYLKQLYDHMDLVAHIPVRNIGTIGGNLFLKYTNNDFQSDVFLLIETVGGMIKIAESVKKSKTVTLTEFLRIDMKSCIITHVLLPPLSKCCSLKTYKIMPRSQNAHAVVNAGFLFKFQQNSNLLEHVTIVYGSISPKFIHASKTENVLVGKDPYTNETLQLALKTLNEEIIAEEAPPEPSGSYRKLLAIALYYKAILYLSPDDKLNPKYRSGGEVIKRCTSSGTQIFDTDKSVWPMNQPIPKLEALVQCSGESVFANDLPTQTGEVFAAFVTADTNPGSIISDFDADEALKFPGVIAFYTAKDIPGINSFTPLFGYCFITNDEEILCSNEVKFYGQPAGIIVANREKTAKKAASLVKIKYASVSKNKPILTIDEVLQSSERNHRLVNDVTVQPTDTGNDVQCVLHGELKLGSQYHYYMETQTCIVRPTEDGLEVYSATQWLDLINVAVAKCLNRSINSINVIVRRVGGGYGGKVSRPAQIACAAALVSHLQGKSCRFSLSIESNMKSIGNRLPVNCMFEVGVNKDGVIQYLKNKYYKDNGCSFNERISPMTVKQFYSCYDTRRWYVEGNSVSTDTASNTWCRSPATEGVAMIENIMERIAFDLGKDPLEIRNVNMNKEDNPIPELIAQIKNDANYDVRLQDIKKFNNNNRWRKRGLKLVPSTYDIFYLGPYNALVSIYHGDGSVVLTHGAVEMGQGINTKAAQVCAYILGIPIEKISVKPSASFTSPNCMVTGASVGSECVCYATMKACEIILKRLEPIRDKLKNPSWEKLIEEAHLSGIDLQASYSFTTFEGVKTYDIYAVVILEVEIDILTGNHDVRRVDLLEDTGRSLNPQIDVAQIEGAFVMGLGYWTSEKMMLDPENGKLLTDRTWTYKPPGIKDIPADFRIYFRRNSRNLCGVLQSKATGEPAFSLAVVITHAFREAIRSARLDAGYKDEWIDLKYPCTVENIFMAIEHKIEHFKLK